MNSIKMAHLFRLLRPEYVRTFPKPLCSDAFRYVYAGLQLPRSSWTWLTLIAL